MRRPITKQLTLSALLCALIAVCAQVHIPLPPVPVSLSLLAVYLSGRLRQHVNPDRPRHY